MSPDHAITGSPDHPILTALHSLILTAIHRHGPQSDMSLWHQTKCQPLRAILVAIAELCDDALIQKTLANASYWQLTEKGQKSIAASNAAANAQEVSLGS